MFSVVSSAAPLAAFAGGTVQEQVRGRNFSDVGVPMYPHEGPAALLGMAVSIGLCGAALWSLYRFLPGGRSLVAWFGVPWLIVCNACLAFAIALG